MGFGTTTCCSTYVEFFISTHESITQPKPGTVLYGWGSSHEARTLGLHVVDQGKGYGNYEIIKFPIDNREFGTPDWESPYEPSNTTPCLYTKRVWEGFWGSTRPTPSLEALQWGRSALLLPFKREGFTLRASFFFSRSRTGLYRVGGRACLYLFLLILPLIFIYVFLGYSF